jgi:hypothetical protein
MPGDQFIGALYAYPWALADQGIDAALDHIGDLAGCREVWLTPCYHRSIFFRPHHPEKPIYFGENGAVYFSPDISRYSGTQIQPRVSKEVADHGYFDRMVEAINRRGLEFVSWTVYTFQDYLTEQYPQFANHDAFGTPHVGRLSTAPQDVQDYFLALTGEIVERFKPAGVVIESLARRGFSAPSKRRGDITPRCSFVLGLCFNPASVENANAAGMDGEGFRREVVEWLRPRLARVPTEEDLLPVAEQWIAAEFDGRLQQYLDIGRKHTTDLWLRVAEVIHASGARIHTNLATADSARRDDLDPVVNKSIDRAMHHLSSKGDEVRQEVRDLRGQIAPEGDVFVTLKGREAAEQDLLTEEMQAAADAGIAGGIFHSYGLLREEQLRMIGKALRSVV